MENKENLIKRLNNKITCGFQTRVHNWIIYTFPDHIVTSKIERNHRFLEEAWS